MSTRAPAAPLTSASPQASSWCATARTNQSRFVCPPPALRLLQVITQQIKNTLAVSSLYTQTSFPCPPAPPRPAPRPGGRRRLRLLPHPRPVRGRPLLRHQVRLQERPLRRHEPDAPRQGLPWAADRRALRPCGGGARRAGARAGREKLCVLWFRNTRPRLSLALSEPETTAFSTVFSQARPIASRPLTRPALSTYPSAHRRA